MSETLRVGGASNSYNKGRKRDFGNNPNRYNQDKELLTCFECSEKKPVSKMNAQGYKYICNNCKEDREK